MKTNAPGPFSCEIYIKSWELGYRDGSAKRHIDNCPFCGPIVHGGTAEFPLSAAEQAKLNIANRKRMKRRGFLKRATIAASFVGLSFLGFNLLSESESTNQATIQAELTVDFASLDAAYATLGRNKIETFANHNNLSIANRTRFWICSRGHTSMYDLVCAGLADPRERVSFFAYNLVSSINPVDLKSHLTLINNCIHQTQSEILREQLSQLVVIIESS